jgi:Leucine-rich repeat (LRR) protein
MSQRMTNSQLSKVYQFAEAVQSTRQANSDDTEAVHQLLEYLHEKQADLEQHLPHERDLFFTFPSCWEDLKLLADSGLQYYLDSIREFDCEGWSGTALPPEFFLMRHLVTAYLGGTNFESISGNYAAMPRLETLVAEEVWALHALDDPSVAEAPRIQEVAISACELHEFPVQLYRASTLTSLTISYCHNSSYLTYPFSTIPPGIAQLRQLKKLDLAGIGLYEIPAELFEMTWLEKLNLLTNDMIPLSQRNQLIAALPNTTILFDPVEPK